MRKVFSFVMALMLVLAMTVSVSAATGVTSLQDFASVAADGSCQVSMAVTLHLEEKVDKLYFPIPANASAVRMWMTKARRYLKDFPELASYIGR